MPKQIVEEPLFKVHHTNLRKAVATKPAQTTKNSAVSTTLRKTAVTNTSKVQKKTATSSVLSSRNTAVKPSPATSHRASTRNLAKKPISKPITTARANAAAAPKLKAKPKREKWDVKVTLSLFSSFLYFLVNFQGRLQDLEDLHSKTESKLLGSEETIQQVNEKLGTSNLKSILKYYKISNA